MSLLVRPRIHDGVWQPIFDRVLSCVCLYSVTVRKNRVNCAKKSNLHYALVDLRFHYTIPVSVRRDSRMVPGREQIALGVSECAASEQRRSVLLYFHLHTRS